MDMQGLKVKILVGAGQNQLISQVGNYTKLYDATEAMHNVSIELAVGDEYVGSASNALALRCIGPVTFVGTRQDDSQVTLNVDGLLFLDEVFKEFSVTNSGTQVSKIWINYAAA